MAENRDFFHAPCRSVSSGGLGLGRTIAIPFSTTNLYLKCFKIFNRRGLVPEARPAPLHQLAAPWDSLGKRNGKIEMGGNRNGKVCLTDFRGWAPCSVFFKRVGPYSRINRCTDAPIWSALELMNQQSILDTAARLAV